MTGADPSRTAPIQTDRAGIERACERLVVDSAAYNDARDWEALARLYAIDAMIGEFSDDFAATDEGWRIVRREARMVMRT